MIAPSCSILAGRRSVFPPRLLPSLILCALLAGASACAPLLNPGPPPALLRLAPAMPEPLTGRSSNKQLVVAMPLAGGDIDTDRIALIFNDREVRHLADARWSSPAPLIFQRALIDAINATNSLRGAADESAGISADAKLLCDLGQFALLYAKPDGAPTAVLSANLRLLNLSNGSIMGARSINVTVQAGGRDNAALAAACESALSRCLAEAAPWVARTMGR